MSKSKKEREEEKIRRVATVEGVGRRGGRRTPAICKAPVQRDGETSAGVVVESSPRAKRVQNIPFGVLRLYQSRELLVIEKAMNCANSSAFAKLAYETAKTYARRDSTKYGRGLSLESASAMEDIAEFWLRQHFGDDIPDDLKENEDDIVARLMAKASR